MICDKQKGIGNRRNLVIRVCAHCGQEFLCRLRPKKGRFCGVKCQRASWHTDTKSSTNARIIARNAVHYAQRIGILLRQPCVLCGATDNVHAHHDDYARPLDVKWLCRTCHRHWHSHPQLHLTTMGESKPLEIKELYDDDTWSCFAYGHINPDLFFELAINAYDYLREYTIANVRHTYYRRVRRKGVSCEWVFQRTDKGHGAFPVTEINTRT